MSDDDFYSLEEDILKNEESPQREEPKLKKLWLTKGLVTAVAIAGVVLILYLDRDSFKFGGGAGEPEKEQRGLLNTIKTNWQEKRRQVEQIIEEKVNETKEDVHTQETFIEIKEEQKKVEEKQLESYGSFKNYGQTNTLPNTDDKTKTTHINPVTKNPRDMSYIKDLMSGIGGKEKKLPTFAERLEVKPLKKVMAQLDYNRKHSINKGTSIQAILKTDMSTDLSGMITATVTQDIYSSNRETLLIPRKSFFVGRYQQGLSKGQSLVFTVWEELRTECGAHVAINSPGTSPMGMPGQRIEIDSHFMERFGSSMLLSVINAGVSIAGGFATQGSSQTMGDIQANLNKSSEIALQDSIKIKPTGYARAGQTIAIMVAHDLDFSNVYKWGDPCEL